MPHLPRTNRPLARSRSAASFPFRATSTCAAPAAATGLRVNRLDTLVCAGDELRTLPLSRAALFVQPETLVRVDQNTTITLSQTTLEIVVEFFQDEIARAARDAQSCGAGYFITRFPKSFRVSTPHLNAAVEGTEFQVRVELRQSPQLTVVEGEVRSETAGHRARSGCCPAVSHSSRAQPSRPS